MIVLDTSTLIRFFTNDDNKKALEVKKILESEKGILIPDVVFPEIEYVLTGRYEVERKELISIFNFLTHQQNIKVSLKLKKAVDLFIETEIDMADCIIVAYSMGNKLASFDIKMQKIPGIKNYFI